MNGLRVLLAVIFVVVTAYTAVVISREGIDLLPIFFGDMAAVTWRGQFNLDFMGFLTLSGLWVPWRNRFSAMGLILAVAAFFLGIVFLSAYLSYLSLKARDIAELMLGDRARS